jgi:hypothetical protein
MRTKLILSCVEELAQGIVDGLHFAYFAEELLPLGVVLGLGLGQHPQERYLPQGLGFDFGLQFRHFRSGVDFPLLQLLGLALDRGVGGFPGSDEVLQFAGFLAGLLDFEGSGDHALLERGVLGLCGFVGLA